MGIKWNCGIQKTQQPPSELWWATQPLQVFEGHVPCPFLHHLNRCTPEKEDLMYHQILLPVPLDSWMCVHHIQSKSQDWLSNQQPDRQSEEKGLVSVATRLHIWGTEERGKLEVGCQHSSNGSWGNMVKNLDRWQTFLGFTFEVAKGGHSCCLCQHLLPCVYPETLSWPLLAPVVPCQHIPVIPVLVYARKKYSSENVFPISKEKTIMRINLISFPFTSKDWLSHNKVMNTQMKGGQYSMH